MTNGSTGTGEVSLARALARAALAVDLGRFDADVVAKAKICLLDFSPVPSRRETTHGAARRSVSRARSETAQRLSEPARSPRQAMQPSPTQPWATAWCAKTCTPPASVTMAL